MTKAGVLALCLFAVPSVASAQTMQWTDKGYVAFTVGAQVGSHKLDTSSTFPLYEETATVTSHQEIQGGGFFDIGGAYRVWGQNLLAGVNFTHTSSDADVAITGSIPDPVFFDRPRAVNTTQTGAQHSENALHLEHVQPPKFDEGHALNQPHYTDHALAEHVATQHPDTPNRQRLFWRGLMVAVILFSVTWLLIMTRYTI